jgi:hypothetical protein
MNCGIALQMVTSILGNCKTIFNERHEMTVERDCFKEILDGFNEGILIVSGDKKSNEEDLEKQQNTYEHDKMDQTQERTLYFTNKEVRRVLGDDCDMIMHSEIFQTYEENDHLLTSNLK